MVKQTYDLIALDSGNAQVKAVTRENEFVFPHALKQLSSADIGGLQLAGELDTDPNIYRVNGVYYQIGRKAIKKGVGAALYGEARYVETYYGVLAAIAMFGAFQDSRKNVYLYGSHTPKDKIYRHDLILAVKGNWVVESAGVTKRFTVAEANGYEEPVGAFRHAIFGDDGESMRGPIVLRNGLALIIDVGGFTVGMTTAEAGRVDYDNSSTQSGGILDVLEELEFLIRRNHARQLKGANFLDPMKLRTALATGFFEAGGHGQLDVKEEREQAIDPLIRAISAYYEGYGGTAEYNGVLLAGGGSVSLERRIRETLKHPHIHVAEEDRKRMHLCTALGGFKVLTVLKERGKL